MRVEYREIGPEPLCVGKAAPETFQYATEDGRRSLELRAHMTGALCRICPLTDRQRATACADFHQQMPEWLKDAYVRGRNARVDQFTIESLKSFWGFQLKPVMVDGLAREFSVETR